MNGDKNKILNGENMNKENLVAIPSGDVLTKEQTEAIYEFAKKPIDIDEEILDKFNSIGCTSFLLTKEELEKLIKK